MKDLKAIWDELISKYTDNVGLSNVLWEEIEENYTDRRRHYHNLTHLKYMTDKAIRNIYEQQARENLKTELQEL